jgi:hypothetical protein
MRILSSGTARSRAPAALAALAGAGSALLLAACSSHSTPGLASPTSTTNATATTTSTTTATTIPFVAAKNARQDVSTTGACTQVGGNWVLKGVVRNSATTARTYQIVVDFVTQPGDTVLDTQIVTTASVKPAAGLTWSAKSTPGLTNVACVIRQVQAPA